MPGPSRRGVLATLGGVLALGIAGCGEQTDGDSDPGTGSTTAASRTPPPSGSDRLRLTAELTPADLRLPLINVALSGETAICASSALAGGRAVVFERDERWQEVATLRPPRETNQFGLGVALDQNTVAVGSARGEDEDYTRRIHVFRRDGGTWMHQQQLHPPDGISSLWFSRVLDISGDYLLAGGGGIGGGAVIHRRAGGKWLRDAVLEPPGPCCGFGDGVAIEGRTAVVGATQEAVDDKDHREGAAYVYRRDDGEWRQQARLRAPDGQEGQPSLGNQFGETIALHDGTLVVGAVTDQNTGMRVTGSCYVFERVENEWRYQTKLVDADGGLDHQFPQALAVGDGLILGQGVLDHGPMPVAVFERGSTGWTQRSTELRPADDPRQSFGGGLAVDDGRALVGAADGGQPTATPNEMSDDPPNLDGGLPSGYVYEF